MQILLQWHSSSLCLLNSSEWQVDGDRKIPLPSVGQDSVSTAGAHAAVLSATNAGSGYMLFA
jgi:hypothetical protein